MQLRTTMGHLFQLVTGIMVFSVLGLTLVKVTDGKHATSGINFQNDRMANLTDGKHATSGINFQNDSNVKERSMANSTGRDIWQGIAESVLCGTSGSDGKKAEAVRDSLEDYDDGSNWIVYVTSEENGWAYGKDGGWEILDKRGLCGKDLLVFKKSTTNCYSSLKEKIMMLIHSASEDAYDHASVRDLIINREYMFSLKHHVIITFTYGSVSSYLYDQCHNFDNSGNVCVFYYGYSTNRLEEPTKTAAATMKTMLMDVNNK